VKRLVVLAAVVTALVMPTVPAAASPQVIAKIHVHPGLTGEFAAFGSVWALSSYDTSWLTRIDPATNSATGRVFLGWGEVNGDDPIAMPIAADDGSLWVARSFRNDVLRIDPSRMRIMARIRVGRSPSDVAAVNGAVFVADSHQSAISRINPHTNRVVRTIRVGAANDFNGGPYQLLAGHHRLWATVPSTRHVVAIDPRTNRVVQRENVRPARACGYLAPAPGGFWLVDEECSNAAYRYDLRTHGVVASYTPPNTDCESGHAVYRGHLYMLVSPFDLSTQSCGPSILEQRNIRTGQLQDSVQLDFVAINPVGLFGDIWVFDTHDDVIRLSAFGSGS
jgi:hypothetical protein